MPSAPASSRGHPARTNADSGRFASPGSADIYVLKEAQLVADGLTLGPVGGRIVAEVFIGLLQRDPRSFLTRLFWRPSLPRFGGRPTGDFRRVDLLAFAGVDPASRGQ